MERPSQTNWLTAEFSKCLAAAIAGMVGKAPRIESETADPAASGPDILWWQQSFSGFGDAIVWVGAGASAWTPIASKALAAAGIENPEPADCRSTYIELIQQAVAGLAASVSTRVGYEILPQEAMEAPPSIAGTVEQIGVHMDESTACSLIILWSPAFPDLLTRRASAAADTNAPAASSSTGNTDRYELLLDVELPVSISFGRAQLPLREIVRLTSGAIVELNRAVNEPVELIVNNCVVARGEVVVVDGNYGVRVKQIISRRERVRTLH